MTSPLTIGFYVTASVFTRYVRSAAGAKRYGVPIGSPIPVGRKVRKPQGERSNTRRPSANPRGRNASQGIELTPAQVDVVDRSFGGPETDGKDRGARRQADGTLQVVDQQKAIATLERVVAHPDVPPERQQAARELRDKIAAAGSSLPIDAPEQGKPTSGKLQSARQTSPAEWASDPDLGAAIEQQRTRWQGTRSSPVLAAVWGRTGFDAKPEVMGRQEFDDLPANYKRYYRGISDPPGGPTAVVLAEQYRSGDHPFPGLGVYGHGTYAAANRRTAVAYADPGGAGNSEAPTDTAQGGAVLDFALRPEAKMFDVKNPDQQDEMDRWRNDLHSKNPRRAVEIGTDIGTAASAMGYDVMTVRNPFNSTAPEYLVVLNRSAVIVAGGDLHA